jgi:dynein heavy chain
VVAFKEKIKELYEEYKEKGPGSHETSLDDGLILLANFKQRTADFNKRKDELINAERLFNLPLSTFPELVALE